MSKYLNVLVCTAFLSSVPSPAKTLEQAAAEQRQDEISPVVWDGQHFVGGANEASSICGALGFVRMVKYSTEPCDSNEVLISGGFARPLSGGAPGLSKQVHACDENVPGRLSSITCAK